MEKLKMYEDLETNKYIKIEVELEQGLLAFFSDKEKKLLILDTDSKDYRGSEYTNKIELKDIKTQESKSYGIVQTISREKLDLLNKVFEYFDNL